MLPTRSLAPIRSLALPAPETYVTQTARVWCDGDENGGDGHPRVWIQIGDNGFADCGYCDRRFILAGSSADAR